MTTIPIEFPPLAPYQKDYIFCEESASIIEACTKTGKTIGCVWWLLREAFERGADGREFWWVAPVSEQAKIAFRRVCRTLRDMDPSGVLRTVVNLSEMSVRIGVNGASLRFKSADKPDSLYGEDVHAAVIDEASRCKEDAYNAVLSTLTATNGKLRIIGNVRGRGTWAYRLARRVEAGTMDGWVFASINADDAIRCGILTREVVEARRREMSEQAFRQLFYNEPAEDGANPFGIAHIHACAQAALAAGPAVAFGIDLARKQDWTVVVGENARGEICEFERWQGLPWSETVAKIGRMVGERRALVDATGVGDAVFEQVAKVCRKAEPYVFTSRTKQDLMERQAVEIQGHTLPILDGVMLREYEVFEFDVHRTHTYYSAPPGLHDDCVCARGLARVANARAVPIGVTVVEARKVKPFETEDEWDRFSDESRAKRLDAFLTGSDL